MAEQRELTRHERVAGITGGAMFLILAWFAIALGYAVCALLAVIFADGFHAIALRLVPPREAEFLWWFTTAVLLIGVTYGMCMAVEFIGEQTGESPADELVRRAAALRKTGARPRVVEPHEMPVTGPSAAEIERNRVR